MSRQSYGYHRPRRAAAMKRPAGEGDERGQHRERNRGRVNAGRDVSTSNSVPPTTARRRRTAAASTGRQALVPFRFGSLPNVHLPVGHALL
jgi:hypothetical protein